MSRGRRQTVGVVAVLLLAVVFLIGLASSSPTEPAAILYAIPVVLCAIALGPIAGVVTGAAAGSLFWLAALSHDERLDALAIGYRMAVLIFLGTLAGLLAARLESSEQSRRRSLEFAEHNAERLAEAQRVAHLGSWEWDVLADSIHWSDELYRIFGVDPAGFDTSYDSYLQLLHPEDRELVESAVRNAFETLDPFSFTHRLIRSDGQVRFVQSTGSAFAEDGVVVRMAGTALDVTERLLAEREAADAREELALREELRRRAVELNDEVVQGLALSGYLLSAGDAEAAATSLRSTLGRAQKLVGDLIDADEIQSGGLRRERAAEVE